MKWVVTAKMKAEILTRFVAEAPSYKEVLDIVNEKAALDEIENFEIVDASPFIDVDDGENRIVN